MALIFSHLQPGDLDLLTQCMEEEEEEEEGRLDMDFLH